MYPACPGCDVGEFNPDKYEFVNFTVEEVANSLSSFLRRLGTINDNAQVIVTVSPVPLVATYTSRHVVEATVYSKSVLRTAAEKVREAHSNCHYFASYEMVTDARRANQFEADGRTVTPEAISKVMDAFFSTFATDEVAVRSRAVDADVDENSRVVCDEEKLAEALLSNADSGEDNSPNSLVFSGKAQQVICLGDSHALPLRNVFLHRDGEATPVLLESCYISGFSSAEMTSGDGRVGTKVLDHLDRLNLLSESGESIFQHPDQAALNILYASGTPAVAPILLIFCGDIDLRGTVFRQFNVSFDVDLAGEPAESLPGKVSVPLGDVEDLFRQIFLPLIKGLTALKDIGFTRTYATMLPPPSMEDEDEFLATHGFQCPLTLRRKLTGIANDVLNSLCNEVNIPFLDVTAEVTKNGLLAEEFRLDGIHMAKSAGQKIVTNALDHAVENSAGHFNAAVYSRLLESAVAADTEKTEAYLDTRRQFGATGVVRGYVELGKLDALLPEERFSEDVGNRHRRLTWCGNSVEPFNPMMRTLTPNEPLLREIYNLVYCDEARPLFQAGVGSDFHILNARFFKSLPYSGELLGPHNFHLDGCPPGVIRALIYLVDVSKENGPFEYLDEAGRSHLATGPKGTLLLFDANRLMHRGSQPLSASRRVIDLTVAPRATGHPRQILSAGMNNWPMDPYLMQVEGMISYPPIHERWQGTSCRTKR